MILIDANLLLYAHVNSFRQHEAARTWLDARLSGTAKVGLPWPSLLAFLRLITNPRVFDRPATIHSAWGQVQEWLGCKTVWVPEPTERHPEFLARMLGVSGVHGNLVPDAHLAALALEHGLQLCSTDSDFARFADLRWVDPLAG